jgi:hypothetical protein
VRHYWFSHGIGNAATSTKYLPQSAVVAGFGELGLQRSLSLHSARQGALPARPHANRSQLASANMNLAMRTVNPKYNVLFVKNGYLDVSFQADPNIAWPKGYF